jgi:hypothetical protein
MNNMTSHENLSHSEMWDDSALVDSWNEALEEYKVTEPPFHQATQLIPT